MKIVFSKPAYKKCQVLWQLMAPFTGVILGDILGEYYFIEDLMEADLSKKNFDSFYSTYFENFQEQLLGVYYFNKRISLNNWLIGDLILEQQSDQYVVWEVDLDKNQKPSKKMITNFEMSYQM